jgi:plasmid stabilization system protein ParE
MPIQWTQRARRQFLAIIDAVLEDNPAAAARVYDAITDSVSRLVTFPEMGRHVTVRTALGSALPLSARAKSPVLSIGARDLKGADCGRPSSVTRG